MFSTDRDVGLTLIVGNILLLAPEEDGFWTFVSLMDSYLRPYFSSSSSQMEVDAMLFSRALEANDPQVAKKVFTTMSLNPTAICFPWYAAASLRDCSVLTDRRFMGYLYIVFG